MNTRIVLINTSHPGNIGATARAMKTMGLSQLVLVDPLSFPHAKAIEMAVGATDILENALVVKTLDEAIRDCTFIAGTSARSRAIPWPVISPRELAEKVIHSTSANVAILFGREQSGLTNEELQRCHVHIQIPSHSDYTSLNLAAAVQVIAYELRVAALSQTNTPTQMEWDYPPATSQEMEGFYEHLKQVLIDADFLKPEAPRQLMTRLRRLFNRTQLDSMEINILRGILTALGKPQSKL